jgi:hypothetical protein
VFLIRKVEQREGVEGMPDRQHTYWSIPEAQRDRLGELPAEVASIADGLEQFVIHHAVARQIGVAVPANAEADRSLRRVSLLLAAAVRRDNRPLSEHREISNYLFVTCRDFAMLAISALREQGVPARLRAGFAGYFNAGIWEDHYLCEHRASGSWAFFDAQLGPISRTGFRIPFDIADVPSSGFRTAASTWRAVRAGELDAATCGLPYAGIAGEWWIASSVLRDAAALAGIECLPWDDWGLAASFRATHSVKEEEALAIDALAQAIEPAPRDRIEAAKLLKHFGWASPSAEELRFLQGQKNAEPSI